jgi:hypothetical protein
MSNQQDREAVEISIADCKVAIERKNMLTRLQDNPDFKVLINEGFLEAHAVRQVMLKAHPGMQAEANQNLLDQQITAIGGFKQFLINVYTEGMNAEATLVADENTLEELHQEDLSNG